jgi:hypothetical protein
VTQVPENSTQADETAAEQDDVLVSGYELAAWLSTKLGRTIPPQMVYNYMRPGKSGTARIATVERGDKRFITRSEAHRFLESLKSGTGGKRRSADDVAELLG